jgi:hypothetical protein
MALKALRADPPFSHVSVLPLLPASAARTRQVLRSVVARIHEDVSWVMMPPHCCPGQLLGMEVRLVS